MYMRRESGDALRCAERLGAHLRSLLDAMTRSQSRTLYFLRYFFVRYLRYLATGSADEHAPFRSAEPQPAARQRTPRTLGTKTPPHGCRQHKERFRAPEHLFETGMALLTWTLVLSLLMDTVSPPSLPARKTAEPISPSSARLQRARSTKMVCPPSPRKTHRASRQS